MLLVTPWFAASAGVVIAVALAIRAPHATLSYGPNQNGLTNPRCPPQDCASPTSGPGALATASPGQKLRTGPGQDHRPKPGTGVGSHDGAGPSHGHAVVGFKVVDRSPWGFTAVVTVPAADRQRNWNLRLSFPDARVESVAGAQWVPSGNGGGTAYGTWHQSDGVDRSPGSQDAQIPALGPGQFMIFATGRPEAPVGCRLDGARCEFR